MEIFNKTILLNSHSPRRKQILEQMGFTIKVVSCECDEVYPEELPAKEVALYLARKKGEAYQGCIVEDQILVSADTVVVFDDCIFGKPQDEKDALQMLKKLSDRRHKVITGCYLKSNTSTDCFFEMTEVRFASISEEEISYYIHNKRPFDKAGAYGIQEWIGLVGVREIKGDYYNVMGLPACKMWQHLKDLDMER